MVVKMSAPGRSFDGVADYCLHDRWVPGQGHPESAGLAPVWWTVLSLSFSTSCSRRCGNCGSRVAASKRRWESRSDFHGLVSFHNS